MLLGRDPHRRRLAVRIAIDSRLHLEPVDLVVHQNLGNLLGTDFREHGIYLGDVLSAPCIARVDNMQQQCGFTRFGES